MELAIEVVWPGKVDVLNEFLEDDTL